jgi:hypothetical protein
MRPEQKILQIPPPVRPRGGLASAATELDAIAARLMTVQRQWDAPGRALHLAAALDACRASWKALQDLLAEGDSSLPPDVPHNLLILSVYADHKIAACESAAGADALAGLAGSLTEWREAA